MVYNEESGDYTLISGRKRYAYCGILGLGPRVEDGISEGYDGWFSPSDDSPFTREEREEIAEEMIRRWAQWRDLGAIVDTPWLRAATGEES